MTPVAAVAADKRFRRAHVKPARRRRHWRFVGPLLALAVAAGAALAAARGASLVAHARALQIDRIVVHGNERLSEGEVLAVLTGLRGQNLLSADLDAWRRRLLASPWVRDAALRRSLPSTVDVLIEERQPIGIARIHDDLYLVDEGGTVIDQYGPEYTDLDLPIIDGLSAGPNGDGPTVDRARADLAARVIAAMRTKPSIAKRVSQVDVADVHNVSVILNGDPAVVELGEDQFLPRLSSYLDLESALHERVADIDYVDLRFDNRIYVKPAAAGRAARRRNGPGRAPAKRK